MAGLLASGQFALVMFVWTGLVFLVINKAGLLWLTVTVSGRYLVNNKLFDRVLTPLLV